MVIGILQVEIGIDAPESLKDKRRVVKSLKDRLHREHMVAVAEVDRLDDLETAVLGIVTAGNDVGRLQSLLDRIVDKLRVGRDFVLHDHQTQVLTGA
jgi:uncharacterized protein YlxP (DUF503 family)